MKSDFDRWLDYHCGAYPGFAKWIADHNNSKQLGHMRRLLESFSIENLSLATDKLYASEDQPRGYGEHARAIRRLVGDVGYGEREHKQDGPTVKDDHLVANCPRCMDFGMVEVISPKSLKALFKNDGSTKWLNACMVGCDCSRGSAKSRQLRIPQWADGFCLIPYEVVMDRAITESRDASSFQDAMWDIAREMLMAFDLQPRAMAMTGDELP